MCADQFAFKKNKKKNKKQIKKHKKQFFFWIKMKKI
jgi:hypothetical protein